jgi:hypothetical protein
MACRELRVLFVVEARIQPVSSGVTSLASRRKELRLGRMSRICSVVVVGLVAADASCRERRVIPVDVTVRTLTRRNRVRSSKREWRVVMVKRRIRPHTRVVAQFTLLRESRSHVIRIRRSLVVLQMAGNASGAFELVVVVDVAVCTLPWRHGV